MPNRDRPSSAPARRQRAIRAPGALTGWLASRILEHLRGLDLAPGAHITEQRLADHFHVSRTPVRAALAALVDAGAVEHEPNRGFFLAQPSAGLAQTEVAAEDEDTLYYRIAEDRLNGHIPQRVTEAQLVRRYKVARKRVAAALTRMAHEGWLRRLPGHGWAFQSMIDSAKGYEDAYRFRAVIEPAALRQPGYLLPKEAIQQLRQVQEDFLRDNARYTDAQAFDIGTGFHEALVAASGNGFLLDALRRANAVRRLVEYRVKRDRSHIGRQYREHIRLLDLIGAGKLEQAAQLMERHLADAGRTKARLVAPPQPATDRPPTTRRSKT